MTDKTYNGWTNYATWRVNLEIFDGFNPVEVWGLERQTLTEGTLAQMLDAYAEALLCDTTPEGLALDYALAFLSDVNWYEIAEHKLEECAA